MPITGDRSSLVLFGALSVKSGALDLSGATKWNQHSFPAHLRRIRAKGRGRHIVWFVDRGSSHRAQASREPAKTLGIELRFLPTACPELMPPEGLWRGGKTAVVASEPTPSVEVGALRLAANLHGLSLLERRQLAGVLSSHFRLATQESARRVALRRRGASG